jgi:hypothetical protein
MEKVENENLEDRTEMSSNKLSKQMRESWETGPSGLITLLGKAGPSIPSFGNTWIIDSLAVGRARPSNCHLNRIQLGKRTCLNRST